MIGPKPPRQPKQIPAANRHAVRERSGGQCEGCGAAPAHDIHHRQYRSRGGTHDLHNLVALCGLGNTSGCHGRAHGSDGAALGWAVPRWAHPELWPAWRHGVGWVIYDDAGGWQPITESTAHLLMNGGIVSDIHDRKEAADGH